MASTELEPAHVHLRVALTRDEDGYPPFDDEEIGAEPVGDQRYRVVTVPVFAQDLAVGDVVEVQQLEGVLWVTRVVEQSDRWLARLIPMNGYEADQAVRVFRSMGCSAKRSSYGLVVVDGPPEVDSEHVLAELEAGGAERDWDWELPVVSPS